MENIGMLTSIGLSVLITIHSNKHWFGLSKKAVF